MRIAAAFVGCCWQLPWRRHHTSLRSHDVSSPKLPKWRRQEGWRASRAHRCALPFQEAIRGSRLAMFWGFGGSPTGPNDAAIDVASQPFSVRGPVSSMLMPFTTDGDIDFTALEKYAKFLESSGVDAVLCNGVAGEFASLTLEERQRVLQCVRRSFSGQVINHVSACALQDVSQLAAYSAVRMASAGNRARTGADAVMIMPPFFHRGAGDEGVERWLSEAISACGVPVFLLDGAETARNPLSAAVYARLAKKFSQIRGVFLDSTSGSSDPKDVRRAVAFKAACPALQVYVGGDRSALETLRCGLDGSFSGASTAVPELLVQLHARYAAGDVAAAEALQARLDRWDNVLQEGVTTDMVPVWKACTAARLSGFGAATRAPLVDLPKERVSRLVTYFLQEAARQEREAAMTSLTDTVQGAARRYVDGYTAAWSAAEVQVLESLSDRLADIEASLTEYLGKSRRQRDIITGRADPFTSRGVGQGDAAEALESVMELRQQLLGNGAGAEITGQRSGVAEVPGQRSEFLGEARRLVQRSEKLLSALAPEPYSSPHLAADPAEYQSYDEERDAAAPAAQTAAAAKVAAAAEVAVAALAVPGISAAPAAVAGGNDTAGPSASAIDVEIPKSPPATAAAEEAAAATEGGAYSVAPLGSGPRWGSAPYKAGSSEPRFGRYVPGQGPPNGSRRAATARGAAADAAAERARQAGASAAAAGPPPAFVQKAQQEIEAFKALERERYFASKGIPVDAVDWSALRRQTDVVESFKRRGVEAFRAKKELLGERETREEGTAGTPG